MSEHGGAREGAGRKSKADEIKLIEKLSPLAPEAFKQLQKGVEKGDFKFIQLFFNYYVGKPKESIDHTTNGEKVSIPLITWASDSEE